MSWWSDFTQESVDQAHQAAIDMLERAQPVIAETENRLSRIAHSLLDRFTINISCEIKLNPYAKASSVEQDKLREQGS